MKRIIISVFAFILFTHTEASAEKVKLPSLNPIDYRIASITSPIASTLWGSDIQDLAKGEKLQPQVYYSTLHLNSGDITISMLSAPNFCGLWECPVRVIQNGFLRSEFPACNNTKAHFLVGAGEILIACGNAYQTGVAYEK